MRSVSSLLLSLSLAPLLLLASEEGWEETENIATAVEDPTNQVLTSQWTFFQSFVASLVLIICSEIGDKTFFIAAILSMKHNHMVVFSGALVALATMTVLSAGLGVLLPALLSRELTHYCCIGLFLFFGLRLLKDSRDMDDKEENEEIKEVEMEIKKKNEDVSEEESGDDDPERGYPCRRVSSEKKRSMVRRVFMQSLVMTFLAEWGDRSQISTIALSAAQDPVGVTIGGILGHSVCSGIAVVGGKMLASKISEKQVSIAGGVLFLVFAVHALWMGVDP